MNKITSPILMLLWVALVVLICSMTLLVKPAAGYEPLHFAFNEFGWSGTQHSASDEWFEITNVSPWLRMTGGMYVEIEKTDGTTSTISIPPFMSFPNDVLLFERTDDTVTTAVADGIYVGALPNSDIAVIKLRMWDGIVTDEIVFTDGLWPAGDTVPRSSMQRTPGTDEWFTSTVGYFMDANEQYVLGTPGQPNDYESPATCQYIPYLGGEHGFDINLQSHQPFVWYHTMLGDGTIASSSARWLTDQKIWTHGSDEYVEETTEDCRIAWGNYQQSVVNILNAQPSIYPYRDDEFTQWLNELRRFQASRPWVGYLPVVIRGD